MKDSVYDYFLIRDPFNNSYNPAKNFRLNRPEEKKFIKEAFKLAYKDLGKNDKFLFDFW